MEYLFKIITYPCSNTYTIVNRKKQEDYISTIVLESTNNIKQEIINKQDQIKHLKNIVENHIKLPKYDKVVIKDVYM